MPVSKSRQSNELRVRRFLIAAGLVMACPPPEPLRPLAGRSGCTTDADCGGGPGGSPTVCKEGSCWYSPGPINGCNPSPGIGPPACLHGVPHGASCVNGTPVCPQETPTVCANTCVNTTTDKNHCGVCGQSCGLHGVCDGSSCTCASGASLCASTGRCEVNCPISCDKPCPPGWNSDSDNYCRLHQNVMFAMRDDAGPIGHEFGSLTVPPPLNHAMVALEKAYVRVDWLNGGCERPWDDRPAALTVSCPSSGEDFSISPREAGTPPPPDSNIWGAPRWLRRRSGDAGPVCKFFKASDWTPFLQGTCQRNANLDAYWAIWRCSL
jgi:hypothetical protein